MQVYKRTENGKTTYLSLAEGVAEIDRLRKAYAQGEIRELFAGSTGAIYTNADGLRIHLLLENAPKDEGTSAPVETATTPAPKQAARSRRIPRNAKHVFHASETTTREDGRHFAGREQKSTTFREARVFLDSLDMPGNVSVWRASTNLLDAYATRATDGSWTILNRLTGKWEPLA